MPGGEENIVPEFKGKVAVVTGASRGLGKYLAGRLATAGCDLVICSRDLQEIEEARAEVQRQTGANVVAVEADVTCQEDVQNMVAAAVSAFSTIDLLVCNAGLVGSAESIHDFDLERWKRIVDVNLYGLSWPKRPSVPESATMGVACPGFCTVQKRRKGGLGRFPR